MVEKKLNHQFDSSESDSTDGISADLEDGTFRSNF